MLVFWAGAHGFFTVFFGHNVFINGHLVCHTSLPSQDREGRATTNPIVAAEAPCRICDRVKRSQGVKSEAAKTSLGSSEGEKNSLREAKREGGNFP